MEKIVQLWVYLSATPLFGLTITLVAYLIATWFYYRQNQAPWANPVLWSIVALAMVLKGTGLPYEEYFAGAQFVHFLLGPAVVALAWPIYQRRFELRQQIGVIAIASVVGGSTAMAAVALLSNWAHLPAELTFSLIPKSVTAPVAMGLSEKLGGIPALAAVLAVLTGLIGSIFGRYIFDLLRIPKDDIGWAARGFALGTAAHGIGAARALQVNPIAGAYAALALGIQVVLCSVVLVPIVLVLKNWL